jgi:transcriptional regulator with XRE-family HTH domain
METLKEIRERLGVPQSLVAEKMLISIPTLSNYENFNVTPTIEDLVNIEQFFGTRLSWHDPYKDKEVITQSLISLLEHYPVSSVVNFASRYLKSDAKSGISMIRFYAEKAAELDQEPLIPPQFKRTK